MRLGGPFDRSGDGDRGGWTKQVELTLGVPIDIADGKLTLVKAVPARQTDGQQKKSLAYRFTFDFQGGL